VYHIPSARSQSLQADCTLGALTRRRRTVVGQQHAVVRCMLHIGAVLYVVRCFRYGFAPLVARQVISSYDGEAGQLVLEEHMQACAALHPILLRYPHPPATRITPDRTAAPYSTRPSP
jgi:hypothetical protein